MEWCLRCRTRKTRQTAQPQKNHFKYQSLRTLRKTEEFCQPGKRQRKSKKSKKSTPSIHLPRKWFFGRRETRFFPQNQQKINETGIPPTPLKNKILTKNNKPKFWNGRFLPHRGNHREGFVCEGEAGEGVEGRGLRHENIRQKQVEWPLAKEEYPEWDRNNVENKPS